MPTFTLTLKQVIKYTGGTVDIGGQQTLMTGGNIGLDVYPIFDEGHRGILNGKIIDRFYNREIGMETIDMFQLAMRRKMNTIMPYYNQLYESERVKFDPLSTVNITNTGENEQTQNTTDNRTSSSSQNSNSKSRAVSSDTPQSLLKPDGNYASSAADSNSQADASTTGEDTGTANATASGNTKSTTTGYQGIPAELIMRAREAFLNVDLMVLNELEQLFMLVWDNGDDYSSNYERSYL